MRPTSIRYWMIGLAMLVAILLYLDRICLSSAAEYVAKDLEIDGRQLDWLLGAFFWTYALGQLPAGWLGDRYGARWMLGAYILLWSLCTGLMGCAYGITAVLFLRLGCGLFEAGAYPVAAGIVRTWMPVAQRALASAVIAVGGRLGGVIAPILTVQLMLAWTHGVSGQGQLERGTAAVTSWRPVMILYGAVGIAIACVFIYFYRDRPAHHKLVNAAERDLIAGNSTELREESTTRRAPPIVPMLLSFSLWMNCVVQFVANFGWAFLVTKLPVYLSVVHDADLQRQGLLQSLPLFAGIFGLLFGGWFTDYFRSRLGPRWGCATSMAISRAAVAIAFVGCFAVHTPNEAIACLALVGFATDFGVPAYWAYGQDVAGKDVGAVVGWSNMWGNFGAAISPVAMGAIVASFAEADAGWRACFLTCAVVNAFAFAAALGVSAVHPLCTNELNDP